MGAPSEVVARLAAARQEFEARQRSLVSSRDASSKDPELDQFMVMIHIFFLLLQLIFMVNKVWIVELVSLE